jgi:hypothetical protein
MELTIFHLLVIYFVAGLTWGWALFGEGPFFHNDFHITNNFTMPELPKIRPLFAPPAMTTPAPAKPSPLPTAPKKPKDGIKSMIKEAKERMTLLEV